jgi:hypothetical protein
MITTVPHTRFVFIYFWASLNRVTIWWRSGVHDRGTVARTLSVLHALFEPMQGFCNALIYGAPHT